MDGVFAKVGTPLLVILGRVLRVFVDLHPPAHVRPEEASKRRVGVVFLVGVGVVLAVIGDPADRRRLRRRRLPTIVKKYSSQLRTQREAPVRQQAVIGQADADPAGQPVQEEADGQPRPGKKGRHKGKKGKRCKAPIQINGTQASRAGAGCAVVVVVMINLCS